jgi:hypothetical protein
MVAGREGKSSLIVAPTHTECRAISEVVRDRQKKEGFLSGEEHAIRRLEKANLTESQRRDAINYNLGQVVEFHRRAKGGFKSGERWEVGRCSSGSVVVVKDGQAKILPLAQVKSFNVYTQEEVSLAVGDSLRITKNFRVGTSLFRNNELCTVTAIDRESITVSGGRVIKRSGPFIRTRVLRSRATRRRAKLSTRSLSACPRPRLARQMKRSSMCRIGGDDLSL